MIRQLAHICIYARDLDETLRFYTDVLGLEIAFRFEKAGQPFGCYLKLGARTFLEIFRGEPGGEGNINHVAFEVEDLDGLIVRARRHGLEVSDKVMGADHAWQAWLTDPNGVRIELHEYTPQSMQLVGGVCRVTW